MWIDVQVGPVVMIIVWALVALAGSAAVYGCARTAEYVAAHRGQRTSNREDWTLADAVSAAILALVAWGAMIYPVRMLVYWLGQAGLVK